MPPEDDHRYSRKPSSVPSMLSSTKPHVPPSTMPMKTVEEDGSIRPNLSTRALTVSEKEAAVSSDAAVPRSLLRTFILVLQSATDVSCTVSAMVHSPVRVMVVKR